MNIPEPYDISYKKKHNSNNNRCLICVAALYHFYEQLNLTYAILNAVSLTLCRTISGGCWLLEIQHLKTPSFILRIKVKDDIYLGLSCVVLCTQVVRGTTLTEVSESSFNRYIPESRFYPQTHLVSLKDDFQRKTPSYKIH